MPFSFNETLRRTDKQTHETNTMKLLLAQPDGNNLITACGSGFVEINQARYSSHLIVSAQAIHTDWVTGGFDNLSAQEMETILSLKPEIVLLGTGEKQRFLHPKHYQALTQQNISLDCMTTAAACRTYNILVSEGRNVVAALLLEWK